MAAMSDIDDRTASLMTPAKLAQLRTRPAAAASPAAWLDQLATDAGSGHVRRLLDLRRQLEAQARDERYGALASALQAWQGAAGELDFEALQPRGWLARATGRGKEEAAVFAARHARVLRAFDDLGDEARALHKKLQGQGGSTDRTLDEVAVEVRAIEKIIDQGARWLQDMRNQLKARAAGASAGDPVAEDAARCELLVERLKLLRAASSAAQQASERSKAVAGRRAAFRAALQQLLEGEASAWQEQLAPVAAEAGASARQGLDAARTAHRDLQAGAEALARECAQLRAQDQALAEELASLDAPLQAAA
jgi:hypothetical protein